MSAAGNAVRGRAETAALSPDAFSPIARMREDGTLTFHGDYDNAIVRLFEYERSGVLPEDAKAGHVRNHWERYTFQTPCGRIYPCRGCELILGRLWAYEVSGLPPRAWTERHGTSPNTK